MAQASAKLHALTGLRFVLALHVVLFHYAHDVLARFPSWIITLVSFGYTSVPFFFALSGFVLSYTYLPLSPRQVSRWHFYRLRFARITPAYALATAISLPLFIHFYLLLYPLDYACHQISLALLLHSTLSQSWFIWVPFPNFPSWSLSCEVLMYTLFPVMASIIARRKPRHLVFIGLCCLLLTFWTSFLYDLLQPDGIPLTSFAHLAIFGPDVTPEGRLLAKHIKDYWYGCFLFNPLAHLPVFTLGVLLGRWLTLQPEPTHPRWSNLQAAVFALAIPCLLLTVTELPHMTIHNGLFAPLFLALIYALARDGGYLGTFLSWRPIVMLGEASYAIYILQEPVHQWYSIVMKRCQMTSLVPLTSGLYFSGYLVVLITVSLIVCRYVERPLGRLLKGARSSSAVSTR